MYKFNISILFIVFINVLMYSQPIPIRGLISLRDKGKAVIFIDCNREEMIYDTTYKYKVVVKEMNERFVAIMPISSGIVRNKSLIQFDAPFKRKLSIFIFRYGLTIKDTMEIKIDRMTTFYIDIKFNKGKYLLVRNDKSDFKLTREYIFEKGKKYFKIVPYLLYLKMKPDEKY